MLLLMEEEEGEEEEEKGEEMEEGEEENEEEEDEDIDMATDPDFEADVEKAREFHSSITDCDFCTKMDHYASTWDEWKPSDPAQVLIKRSIDAIAV